MCENFQDCLESYQIVWNVFRLSGNFQGCLKTFQVVWKVSSLSVSFTYCLNFFFSRLSGNFPENCKLSWLSGKFSDYLEGLQVVCKLSKFYVHLPYYLESAQSVLKVSRLCGNFQECLVNFLIVRTVPLFSRKFLHYVGWFRIT